MTDEVCLVRHSRPVFPYVEGGSMVDILVLGATGTSVFPHMPRPLVLFTEIATGVCRLHGAVDH